jgi:hypothetical protein
MLLAVYLVVIIIEEILMKIKKFVFVVVAVDL